MDGITERDAVLRERRAYARGAWEGGREPRWTEGACQIRAVRLYPLPKMLQTRVERDPECAWIMWRVNEVDGLLEYTDTTARRIDPACGHWRSVHVTTWSQSQARYTLWADLLAHPTKWVECDGSEIGQAQRATDAQA